MYSCHVTFGLNRGILPYRVSDNEQDTCCTVEDAVLISIPECKSQQHWTCVCNMWRAQQAKANEKGKERAGNKEKKERGNLNKKHPLLPGICLAVVFSGNNVFKQLTSSHPEMQEVQLGYLLIQTGFLFHSARLFTELSCHGDENSTWKLWM